MSSVNIQDLLQMLDSLSSSRDRSSDEQSLPLQKNTANGELNEAFDDANRLGQSAYDQCGSGERHAVNLQLPPPSRHDANASPAAAVMASAKFLHACRNGSGDGAAPLKQTNCTSTNIDQPAQTATRSSAAPAAAATTGLFRSGLRAATLENVQSLPGLSNRSPGVKGALNAHDPVPSAASSRVFDAAAILFPEVLDESELPTRRQQPVHASSTIVQRVIKRLSGMRLRVLHAADADLRAYNATFVLSDDGQEVIWKRDSGIWSNFFIRDMKDLIMGSRGLSQSGFEATLADDRMFVAELPARALAFEAETPQLMQLWLVGLLALLESSASVASTIHIWRSVAPRLKLGSTATAAPNEVLNPPIFSPSVEAFLRGLPLARNDSAAHMPWMNGDPLMTGTFLRRVQCADVVYIQTLVTLGAH
jgi:hypothetical protein